MSTQNENIEGESLKKPLVFNGSDVKLDDFKISRSPYPLEKDEFYILTKSSSDLKDWQKRFLQIGFGVCLTICSKILYFSYLFNSAKTPEAKSKVEISIAGWEVISLILAFGTWLILLIISQFKKSEKNKLTGVIKNHFTRQS